jgi:hypothetical protein
MGSRDPRMPPALKLHDDLAHQGVEALEKKLRQFGSS